MTEGMGKTAVCTKCSQAFRIGAKRPEFEWRSTDLGEDSWIGVPAPTEKREIKHCIMCEAPLEDGAVRCLACGVNQVTGVIQRPATPRHMDDKVPIWSMIPFRLIAVGIVVVLIGTGVYWMVSWLSEDTQQLAIELEDRALVNEVMEELREGRHEWALAGRYRGRVKDDNLPRFVHMLGSDKRELRQAATLLIGCGDLTQIAPIVEMTESSETARQGMAVLHAIGVRRLATLSVHKQEEVRQSAAKGLCLLMPRLDCDDEVLNTLAGRTPYPERIGWLNHRCRAYPEATGGFGVIVDQTPVDYGVEVDQIGSVFYLRFQGGTEFTSSPTEPMVFDIPLAEWCAAATGRRDVGAIGRWLGGSVRLGSPTGMGWVGTVTVRAKQGLPDSIPGLPMVKPPEWGDKVEVPIRLERP